MSRLKQEREHLPNRRVTETIKHKPKGMRHSVFVTLGYYPDGRVAEVFISSGREGDQTGDLIKSLAMSISLALQYGAPLEKVTKILDGYEESSVCRAVHDVLIAELNKPIVIPTCDEVVVKTEVEVEDEEEWTNPT